MSAFEPWLPVLRGLTRELEDVLGPWMASIHAAIGPVRAARAPDAEGDVAGWTGITHRGPVERLVVSEWALADAWPDEFLRRAAEGELLFLEREHHQPRGARWTVALFDTGPDQLGTPRLVHLALIVALASRRGASERFSVGALHHDRWLEPALDRESGRAMGAARTRRAPEEGWAAAWRERLAAGDPELWVVGGAAATGLAWGRANRVAIDEDVHTGALRVGVTRSDGAVARATLPAPRGASPSLVRDPFAPRRIDPPAVDAVDAVYGAGRWLYVRRRRGETDALFAVATPAGVSGGTKAVAQQTERGRVVGAAKNGRIVSSLWCTSAELVGVGLQGSRRRMPRPEGFEPGPLRAMSVVGAQVWVQDGAGLLWALDFAAATATCLAPTSGPPWFSQQDVSWSDGSAEVVRARDGVVHRELEGIRVGPLVDGVGLLRRPTGLVRHATRRPRSTRVVFAGPWAEGALAWIGGGLSTYTPGVGLAHRRYEDRGGGWVPLASGIEVPLDRVSWIGASPDGRSVAALRGAEVSFFDPCTGALQCTWEVP